MVVLEDGPVVVAHTQEFHRCEYIIHTLKQMSIFVEFLNGYQNRSTDIDIR